jgi:hypothetical protein
MTTPTSSSVLSKDSREGSAMSAALKTTPAWSRNTTHDH